MKSNKLLTVITIALTSYFFIGCFGVDAKFFKIKNSVMNHVPKSYYTHIELGAGSVSLSLLNMAVKFSSDKAKEDASLVLSEITKVQVGVYKNKGGGSFTNIKTFLDNVAKDLRYTGWVNITRSIDHDEMTSIYLRPDHGQQIRELLVINFEKDALVIANVEGNFSQALANVISSGQMHIKM